MTATDARQADVPRPWRGLTAVLALYALALQAVLGGASTLPDTSPFGVICLSQPDDSGATGPAAPQGTAHRHAGCCTLCHPAVGPAPPSPAATAVVWPTRVASRPCWRADAIASATAPPLSEARPRAPPVV